MDYSNNWSSLFSLSSFYCLKKDDFQDADLSALMASFDYPVIESYHPKRKNEFLLGRACASKAHELQVGAPLLILAVAEDRSPVWPSEIIGSITHCESWVGAAVSEKKTLLGVGIDFEKMGRAKMEIGRYIKTPQDLSDHPMLSNEELITVIFSIKESLYKALYPTVKVFFGFDSAAVKEVDVKNGTFKIELLKKISPDFGPSTRYIFEGKLMICDGVCLSVLEVLY